MKLQWKNHGGEFTATDRNGVEWIVFWDAGWDSWRVTGRTLRTGCTEWRGEFPSHEQAMRSVEAA